MQGTGMEDPVCCKNQDTWKKAWAAGYSVYAAYILKHCTVPCNSIQVHVEQNSVEVLQSESSLDTNNNLFRRNLTDPNLQSIKWA